MSHQASNQRIEASQFIPHSYEVIIDTDIGDDIDDAFALALALHSPEIELLGVTTVFGDTRLRAHLAKYVLETYGHGEIPVAAGQQMPLLYRHRASGVPQAAILDPCKKERPLSQLSAPELIIQTALSHHGNLILFCIGPLTNVATALLIEPGLFLAIKNIVMIGGTTGFPMPEWNIRSDAQAANIVLASGIPITLLGLNMTMQCQLRESDIEKLHYQNTQQTRLLCQLLAIWQRHRPRWHPRLPFLHDPLAMVAFCAPELFQFEVMTARVPTSGPFKGCMLTRMLDGPLVFGATGIRHEHAREWIMQRLLLNAI
jgi:purine nucleosidase/pyrimidine-specific ribonucleoside hydrolase